MQKLFIFIIYLIYSLSSSSQTNFSKFKKYFDSGDTVKVKELLTEWEKTDPNDAELYTSAFNYYFSKSKEELLSLETTQTGQESLAFSDSTGKTVGYINSSINYEESNLNKALSYINNGIKKYPTRLDMRFGKCFVLGQVGNYKEFTEEIIKALEYSKQIDNKWTWTENKLKANAEETLLSSTHSYMKQLYDTENDDLLKNITQIGDVVLKYYPKNVEILSITSVAYMLNKDNAKAILYLKMAEKINPEDFIVLSNIAQAYMRSGEKESAIKYFELSKKYGDEQAKENADRFIKELRSK